MCCSIVMKRQLVAVHVIKRPRETLAKTSITVGCLGLRKLEIPALWHATIYMLTPTLQLQYSVLNVL